MPDDTQGPPAVPAPLAVDADGAARMIGVGRAHFWRLVSSGRAPAPVRLGRRAIWPIESLRAWLEAGCPPRDRAGAERWKARKAQELAAVGNKQAAQAGGVGR